MEGVFHYLDCKAINKNKDKYTCLLYLWLDFYEFYLYQI